MKSLIISPWSRNTRKNTYCAKNYPYWKEVVNSVKDKYHLIQIGAENEEDINCHEKYFGLKFSELKELLFKSDGWLSVDNFFPHFVHYYKGPSGIVIFSKSDPSIFGYNSNINLLKSRSFLRRDQFAYWDDVKHEKEAFVSSDIVVQEILQLWP